MSRREVPDEVEPSPTVTTAPESKLVAPATVPARTGVRVVSNERCGRYTVLDLLGTGNMGVVVSAYDPVLARKVALKLLLPSQNPQASDGAARLQIEAQAMARLAHPNVVTVFEVDRVDDQVFVAMELVEGSTLRAWLAEKPRGWREVVEMFVAAGRGLAAAHAAGLVHRDFKPDNVLIGGDGRPRVSDFGIASARGGGDGGDGGAGDDGGDGADAGSGGTPRGKLYGTPAYMPPEQWSGRAVDARSDQFAFCVALWEGVCGRRPFSGETRSELRASVNAGALAASPGSARVPRGVVAALRRGLSIAPASRWPDLTALLDVLARAASVRRRTAFALVAMALVCAMVAVVAVVVARGQLDPCAAPTERTAAVWSPAREDALRRAFAAVDPAQGAPRAARIAAVFDQGIAGFRAMHVEACRANRVEGRQSDTLLDRRMACLDRWLGELASTVAAVDQARTLAAVDGAAKAAAELSPLAACADLHALDEALPPPANANDRAAALALEHRTQELEVDRRAGRLEGLLDKARELVRAARALGYPPTLDAALALLAKVDGTTGQYAEGEPVLRELVEVAARAHDDRTVAFAWTNLIMTLGSDLGKRDDGLALIPTANAAVLRAGDPDQLRAELLYSEGAVLDDSPRAAEGVAALTRARQLLEGAAATPQAAAKLADVIFELGAAQLYVGNVEAALASYRDAIARWQALYGPDSPDEVFGWQNIGALLEKAERNDEALAAFRNAARIVEARIGPSPRLAFALEGIATLLVDQQKWSEALATYERSLAMFQAQLSPGDLEALGAQLGRGIALVGVGRLDDAARDFDAVVAAFEAAGAQQRNLFIALYNRGDLKSRRGQCGAAIADFRRATATLEALSGRDDQDLVRPLVGEARCLVRAGRLSEAIARLERALRLPVLGANSFQLVLARAYLARAEVETGRDVAGGLARVRAAMPAIAASSEGAEAARDLGAWLAARAR